MGSLSASGIPVVTKQPVSFRKHDVRIKSTDNRTDVTTVVTANRPELSRAIGSGSVVGSGDIRYFEELVVGAQMMGRSANERIASAASNTRQVVVDLAGNVTKAVIASGLRPAVVELHASNRGTKIGIGNSSDDSQSRV